MSTPHKCPVCNGYGTVSKPSNVLGDQNIWFSSVTSYIYPCPACIGTGIIWEFEERKNNYPIIAPNKKENK